MCRVPKSRDREKHPEEPSKHTKHTTTNSTSTPKSEKSRRKSSSKGKKSPRRPPPPSPMPAFPTEYTGFIHSFPRFPQRVRQGECQSLNAIIVQYFPGNDVGAGEPGGREEMRRRRNCPPYQDEGVEGSAEGVTVKDDSFRITSVAQEPIHYPFRPRGGRDGRRGSSSGSCGGRSQGSGLGARESTSRIRPIRDTHPRGNGPLPWPLRNIDTTGFSLQPEFRPFLEPRAEE